jgi:hypothetical protein
MGQRFGFYKCNMIELKQTGFMSNRDRQNVASYFCNELNMDWRLELLTLSHSSSIMMLVAIGVIGPTAG